MAYQVGKAYNICPPASWSLLKGLDAIMRLRSFFEFRLVPLGNCGMINAIGIIWGRQHPYHYVTGVPGLVSSVLDVTVLRFTSHASRELLLQLLRVETIIMIASNHWNDIRCSGLFSSVG